MFENLSERLDRSFKLLKGEGKITEINVAETLKDVRKALLDADVNYKVAKSFTDTVKEKALGQNVLTSVKPSQLMVKIVHDELASLMGGTAVDVNLQGNPAIILMSGLQGSNTVLRGDVNTITVGDRTNIQDGTVIHTLYDGAPHPSQTHIGNDVSIGHNATIHGAVIEDGCLIGMGATVLDNAVVASGCIVAANALVLSGAKLEPNSVYAGVPARKVKEVTPEQREEIIHRIAHDYHMYASWYEEDK